MIISKLRAYNGNYNMNTSFELSKGIGNLEAISLGTMEEGNSLHTVNITSSQECRQTRMELVLVSSYSTAAYAAPF